MIVRRSDLERVVKLLSATGTYSLDTETTGLRPFHQDELFSIIISDENKSYYFNFQEYPGLSDEWVLPRIAILKLDLVLSNPQSTWHLSNAKFDMHFLNKEGLKIAGTIHCTEALGRVERNDRMKYGLDALAKTIGLEKSDAVEDWIKTNGAWEWETIPGKEKRTKKKFFNQVPFDTIVPYGEQDASVTLKVGRHQVEQFNIIASGTAENLPSILQVVENERKFTKTCFEIEQTGVLIDRNYCERAIEYEEKRLVKIKWDFKNLTGLEFEDSRSVLEKAFSVAGETIPRTDKGNPSFNDEALSSFTSPVGQVVRDYRDAHKKTNTYYRNFIHYADADGVLHANLKQGGCTTGRMSVSDPALQTLPDEEEEENLAFKIRRAFIPRDGFFFFMPDYEQMEYRMMFDYARQMDFIDQVKGGLDVHDATVKVIFDLLGIVITRGQSKTLNFGLLYGMGIAALAAALKTTVEKARQLKNAYFQALPFVQGFIRRVTHRAETTGYIFNWAGRRSYFDKKEFCYKAPNALIQGGCADVLKIATNRCQDYLAGRKSKILMLVHDEILFEIHESEYEICGDLIGLMGDVYPHRHLHLSCSAEHSFRSWGDKVKGYAS